MDSVRITAFLLRDSKMKILNIDKTPLVELPFLNAGRGAGSFYDDRLPVLVGTVDRLPQGVDTLVLRQTCKVESILSISRPTLRLLGEWLPKVIRESILPLIGQPATKLAYSYAAIFIQCRILISVVVQAM